MEKKIKSLAEINREQERARENALRRERERSGNQSRTDRYADTFAAISETDLDKKFNPARFTDVEKPEA